MKWRYDIELLEYVVCALCLYPTDYSVVRKMTYGFTHWLVHGGGMYLETLKRDDGLCDSVNVKSRKDNLKLMRCRIRKLIWSI